MKKYNKINESVVNTRLKSLDEIRQDAINYITDNNIMEQIKKRRENKKK